MDMGHSRDLLEYIGPFLDGLYSTRFPNFLILTKEMHFLPIRSLGRSEGFWLSNNHTLHALTRHAVHRVSGNSTWRSGHQTDDGLPRSSG